MITSCEKSQSMWVPTTQEEFKYLLLEWQLKTKNFQQCESPIEHEFLHAFYKVISDQVTIEGQVDCHTPIGRFRFDFVVKHLGRKIGFECDGKNFHDRQTDLSRDAAILKTGLVDIIYRVPGKSLWFYTYEVLDLLRIEEPDLFSSHGNGLLDAILDDGAEREDNREIDHVIRTLRKEDEDSEYKEDRKISGTVFLEWRTQSLMQKISDNSLHKN